MFFLCADVICLELGVKAQQYQGHAGRVDEDDLKSLVQDLKRYIMAVDCPGALGIWLIIVCSHMLYPASIQVIVLGRLRLGRDWIAYIIFTSFP